MVSLRDNTVGMWRELWLVIRFVSLLYRPYFGRLRIIVVRLLETIKQFSSTQKRLRDSLIVFDCSVIYLMIAERIPPNPFIAYQIGLKRFGPFNIGGGCAYCVHRFGCYGGYGSSADRKFASVIARLGLRFCSRLRPFSPEEFGGFSAGGAASSSV